MSHILLGLFLNLGKTSVSFFHLKLQTMSNFVVQGLILNIL